MEVRDVDLAYAAGLFDGEGSISICCRKQSKRSISRTYGIKTVISMVDADSVLWMAATFGGPCDTTSRSQKYLLEHPGVRIIYRWSLNCRKAADFLELILPYLKLKHSRAEAAIKLARMARHRGAQKGHEGMHVMSEEELAAQKPIADFIRAENQRNNPRIKSCVKWGIQ